jgi:hypothetical protein
MFGRLKKIYHEFPRLFWIVVVVSFIDRIGGTLYSSWLNDALSKFQLGVSSYTLIFILLCKCAVHRLKKIYQKLHSTYMVQRWHDAGGHSARHVIAVRADRQHHRRRADR